MENTIENALNHIADSGIEAEDSGVGRKTELDKFKIAPHLPGQRGRENKIKSLCKVLTHGEERSYGIWP